MKFFLELRDVQRRIHRIAGFHACGHLDKSGFLVSRPPSICRIFPIPLVANNAPVCRFAGPSAASARRGQAAMRARNAFQCDDERAIERLCATGIASALVGAVEEGAKRGVLQRSSEEMARIRQADINAFVHRFAPPSLPREKERACLCSLSVALLLLCQHARIDEQSSKLGSSGSVAC